MTTFQGSADGIFTNPSGGVTSGVGTNYFLWGASGFFGSPSSLQFIDHNFSVTTPTDYILGSEAQRKRPFFSIGALHYYNGSSQSGTLADNVRLDTSIRITSPITAGPTVISSQLNLDNTLNTDDPIASADSVFLPKSLPPVTLFTASGMPTTVEPSGFGNASSGGFTQIDRFFVLEGASASADLFAQVVSPCEPIVRGAVKRYDDHSPTMLAVFTPNFGLTMDEATSLCGYKHFNWYQEVTHWSSKNLFAKANPNVPLTAPPPFVDPPLGGYTYPDTVGYDDLPFYLGEGSYDSFRQYYTFPTQLEFKDSPANSDLKQQQNEFMGFKTCLVGVKPDNTWDPLYCWNWTSNFNGTVGGVSMTGNTAPVDPGSGTGGVTLLNDDLSVEDIPQSERELMKKDGARNMDVSPNYYWTWYDNVYMRNWVLMANPVGLGTNLNFSLAIGGKPQSLGDQFGLGAGTVPAGNTLTPTYPGIIGGPVQVTSATGDEAIVSQRSLLGNSLEEVLGTKHNKLSDHYFWTWYDEQSPGYKNWVLVANPNDFKVSYSVKIAGQEMQSGTIDPGQNVTPRFPGVMGGPVEVSAVQDGTNFPANVIASQRVLSNNGTAFNEVPGIPAGDLSDSYLWTWYDNVGSNSNDWVLVANPNTDPIYYEITVAGQDPGLGSKGTIDPGKNVTPKFPDKVGGPLEVRTWTDDTKAVPAKSIASQRVIWGPSFEEVPGYPVSALPSDYHWTWYDQQSSGSTNWVLVANPSPTDTVHAQVSFTNQADGTLVTSESDILPGTNWTPTFPTKMGGPVEVRAWTDGTKTTPANVMASQRVLWNGFFNEVLGTVLN